VCECVCVCVCVWGVCVDLVSVWECVIELLSDCVIEWVSVSVQMSVNVSEDVIELVSV
jgi:hypothetical protein